MQDRRPSSEWIDLCIQWTRLADIVGEERAQLGMSRELILRSEDMLRQADETLSRLAWLKPNGPGDPAPPA